MSSAPAHLREVAESLRATARSATADVAGLHAHVGPGTWEGPAADAARRRAFGVAHEVAEISAGLRTAADRLDAEAAEVEAREGTP